MSDEKEQELPTLCGRPIQWKCPCGERVYKNDRQELVFNWDEKQWYRVCTKCVTKNVGYAGSAGTPRLELV